MDRRFFEKRPSGGRVRARGHGHLDSHPVSPVYHVPIGQCRVHQNRHHHQYKRRRTERQPRVDQQDRESPRQNKSRPTGRLVVDQEMCHFVAYHHHQLAVVQFAHHTGRDDHDVFLNIRVGERILFVYQHEARGHRIRSRVGAQETFH